ncbi:sulfite exporter TauE/SafE family protein [Mesorhizobium sp. B1-1-8]|uniref:HoxN/HupN/NixA family nickel/cobalt transporter n=1 Tax=Mesorhizobium sp. B1-1-8 TaxID=2589976 RepID=UPI00112738FB|nr:sulfite exporter TauE/SafE family protein [Mesorhizobium sp. B1-1-8]UCI08750.1 ABC transporter permease [Mesorhizobium sp. B1-1-8]
MLQMLVEFQRTIYLALAEQIKLVSAGGGWLAFLTFLPMGIIFGAAHALTPGHSKSILATYLIGSESGLSRGLGVSLVLSFTHVTMAVLIALLSLPLVSIALGSVGRAPMLEDVSRGLLGLIGLWMLWRAVNHRGHSHYGHEGEAVGIMAGLIPCPLTLFAMTFAISRGVPEAGLAFAATMMLGVAFTLSAVALLAVFFRRQLLHLLQSYPRALASVTWSVEGIAGAVLAAVAVHEIFMR